TAPPSRERASPDEEWLSKAARATALWKQGGRGPKDRFGRRPVTRAMLNAIRDATGAWSRRKAVAAGARLVLGHHLLAPHFREPRAEDAADPVDAAARRERHDELHEAVGPA